MRVFNVNKAIGLASSGVEYAQKYRRELLADIAWVDDYYVFTDYIPTNLTFFSDRLGFEREQVLWIYNVVTGRAARPSTITLDAFTELLAQPYELVRTAPDRADVTMTDSNVHYRLWLPGDEYVDRAEMWVGDRVVRVEHYDDTLNHIEYFHDNHVARRTFYASDGRIAAEQFYRGDDIARTVITPASPLYERPAPRHGRPSSFRGDVVLDGRSQFFQHFFRHLVSRSDDVVIVDRALDVIDGIYPVIGDRRLYSVVHAEHFDLKQSSDGLLLWNNHYENVFTRPELVDGFIVSTHRQRDVLAAQLAAQGLGDASAVACIPVGYVASPAARPDYDRSAVVTASRLADEKHLDVLVRAVALARERLPGLHLDIYGEGNREPLLSVIEEATAQDYVRLMGHQSLDGLLGGYGLYVTASWSEGFGLSLLEATAEGLPIVGFDVDYGNRELVEQGVNGFLVPCTFSDRDVMTIADAIVAVLSSDSLDELRAASLRTAAAYTGDEVRTMWECLLREEETC